jgi:hypothetical protein
MNCVTTGPLTELQRAEREIERMRSVLKTTYAELGYRNPDLESLRVYIERELKRETTKDSTEIEKPNGRERHAFMAAIDAVYIASSDPRPLDPERLWQQYLAVTGKVSD